MLSEQASQNISVVGQNKAIVLADLAIQCRTKNGMTYQMYSIHDTSLRYQIIQHHSQRSILSIKTDKAVRLPIIEIEFNYHVDDPWSISIGPVCFS
jgi:hypothetical protein